MTSDSSPALIIRFPPTATAVLRDRLVALLADYHLVAIQEDDIAAPQTWTAHFENFASRDAAAAALAEAPDIAPLQIDAAQVEDEDWARRTQADLPAVRVGRIIVAPPWDVPAATDLPLPSSGGPDILIEIEPARGFGTGHHQSTRLCLALLQNRQFGERTVLDVGTGSGVLAITAARLGAAFVSAIDVDPDAVENARENIQRNHVENTVEAHVRDLTDPALTPADLITANLTGTLLSRYSHRLTQLVKPGGTLIAAGFTVDEREMVRVAFEEELSVTESAEEDDWWAFVFTRRAGVVGGT